jgi:ATP-dependent protease ClpP protease subunit
MDLSRLKTTRRIANLQAGRNDWYRVIKAQAPDQATQVMVYDEVGYWGVTAQDFINDLKSISGPIDLHLNSPGGEVWDGIAIYQYLAGRGGVTTYIDSLAASIASVIAMAGTEIVMGRNASVMVHDGWGLCIGNAADMREQADLLDRVSDNIANVYADRTGKPVDEWRKVMLAETWFFGQEAVDAGLADRLAPSTGKQQSTPGGPDDNSTAAAMRAHFDLSVFRNVPDRLKTTHASAGNNMVEIDLTAAAGAAEEFAASLRKNIRIQNQAAETAPTNPEPNANSVPDPPPTPESPPTPQTVDQAPDPTDRGFSMPAGDPMDAIPADVFRNWLDQGRALLGEPEPEPTQLPDGGHVHNAAMHEPFDGTHTHAHPAFGAQGNDDSHEHEHTHNNDADHHHDHGDAGGEESDGDGGMQNAKTPKAKATGRILGIESMPLLNKALPVHHTATVDEPWDGPAAVAAMPNDDSVLRYCHAWMSDEAAAEKPKEGDDDADDQKSNYRFPHHKTEGGPANLAACRNGLARLPGSKIPDSDKAGVEKHLQAHLDDADKSDSDDSDGASNNLQSKSLDDFEWDPELFKKAMEGAQQ